MREYDLPLSIDFDRPVAHEETVNLIESLADARNRLDRAAAHLVEHGTPITESYDDLDRDTLIPYQIDFDMMDLLDHAITRGEQLLEKQGYRGQPEQPAPPFPQQRQVFPGDDPRQAGEDTM